MATDEDIEAGAARMYGKNWNSEDQHKRPGEAMKAVWRKYAKDCLEGAEEGKYIPQAVYYDEGKYTEIALRDVPMVWSLYKYEGIEYGYDFEGNLAGVRIWKDVRRRNA